MTWKLLKRLRGSRTCTLNTGLPQNLHDKIPWLFNDRITKFHDLYINIHVGFMTLCNFSHNSMSFPETPENFKIPEIPWLFHDHGNPATAKPYQIKRKRRWQLQVLGMWVLCHLTWDLSHAKRSLMAWANVTPKEDFGMTPTFLELESADFLDYHIMLPFKQCLVHFES